MCTAPVGHNLHSALTMRRSVRAKIAVDRFVPTATGLHMAASAEGKQAMDGAKQHAEVVVASLGTDIPQEQPEAEGGQDDAESSLLRKQRSALLALMQAHPKTVQRLQEFGEDFNGFWGCSKIRVSIVCEWNSLLRAMIKANEGDIWPQLPNTTWPVYNLLERNGFLPQNEKDPRGPVEDEMWYTRYEYNHMRLATRGNYIDLDGKTYHYEYHLMAKGRAQCRTLFGHLHPEFMKSGPKWRVEWTRGLRLYNAVQRLCNSGKDEDLSVLQSVDSAQKHLRTWKAETGWTLWEALVGVETSYIYAFFAFALNQLCDINAEWDRADYNVETSPLDIFRAGEHGMDSDGEESEEDKAAYWAARHMVKRRLHALKLYVNM